MFECHLFFMFGFFRFWCLNFFCFEQRSKLSWNALSTSIWKLESSKHFMNVFCGSTNSSTNVCPYNCLFSSLKVRASYDVLKHTVTNTRTNFSRAQQARNGQIWCSFWAQNGNLKIFTDNSWQIHSAKILQWGGLFKRKKSLLLAKDIKRPKFQRQRWKNFSSARESKP